MPSGLSSASPRAFRSEAGAAALGRGPEGQRAAFEQGPHQPCRWELASTSRCAGLFEAVPQCALCLLPSSLSAETGEGGEAFRTPGAGSNKGPSP